MKKKLLLCFSFIIAAMAFGQNLDDYRSINTGNWENVGVWQRYNGTAWVAALAAPSSANGLVTIQNSHTITVSNSPVIIDQVLVSSGGTLRVAQAVITLENDPGTEFDLLINTNGTLDLIGSAIQFSGDGVNGAQLKNNGTLSTTGSSSFNDNSSGAAKFINSPNAVFVQSGQTSQFFFSIQTEQKGIIQGEGKLAGNVLNEGMITPGFSPGILSLEAFGFHETGSVSIEIKDAGGPGIGHDQLQSSLPNGSLAGILNVTEIGTPPTGDYVILKSPFAQIFGAFTTVNLPSGYCILYNVFNETENSYNIILHKGTPATYYADKDGDTYGDQNDPGEISCTAINGKVTNNKDCDDSNAAINPAAGEIPGNGIDENCDGKDVCPSVAGSCTAVIYVPGVGCVSVVDNNNVPDDGNPCTDDVCINGTPSHPPKPAGSVCPGGYCDGQGNCVPLDTDVDGVPDISDDDDDGDGILDQVDNCPLKFNPDQTDADSDGHGSLCDCNDNNAAIYPQANEACNGIDDNCNGQVDENCPIDTDKDGITNASDNCPFTYNPDQLDADGDGYGSACDCNDNNITIHPGQPDICNNAADDNCNGTIDENNAIYYQDTDRDGYGDQNDPGEISCTAINGKVTNNKDCDDSNAAINPAAGEIPGNGIDENCDGKDVCPSVAGSCTAVIYVPGVGCVSVVDNNNVPDDGNPCTDDVCINGTPSHPPKPAGSVCPGGYCDGQGNCVKDTDFDGIPDNLDNDDDGDGVLDLSDNCPMIANSDQQDADGDGIGDVCDNDDDGDGVLDATDNCPLVFNADQLDTDRDGIGDVCDNDDDGDGVPDSNDNCTLIANADQHDTDGDGIGNVCDTDDDNDGILDASDNCPTIANPGQEDADNNGIGNVCEQGNNSPMLLVSQSALAFPPTAPGVPSNILSYMVNGTGLAQPITVTIFGTNASEIELSQTGGNGFTPKNQLSLTPVSGVISATIFVRINSSTIGTKSATITHSSEDPSGPKLLAITGNVLSGEICDGLDNDGDGLVDEEITVPYYRDIDGDGYGNPNDIINSCAQPDGYVLQSGDCNDLNAGINPGTVWAKDADNDGYGDGTIVSQCEPPVGFKAAACLIATHGDCNDNNAAVHPGATEICGNGIDDDCNELTPDACPITDADNDGDPDVTDCNDNNPNIHHGATEICGNGIDDDCDESTSDVCPVPDKDNDGDPDDTDCDDNNPNIHHGAAEVCNGIDDDCNGLVDDNIILVATISPAGTQNICPGTTLTLVASPSTGGATFQWFKNNKIIDNQTASILAVSSSGDYKVKITQGNCSAISPITTVTLISPQATIKISGKNSNPCSAPVQLMANNVQGSYQWYKDGALQSSNGSSFTATSAGEYWVVIIKNGCSSESNHITLSCPSVKAKSTETTYEIASTQNDLKVQPNPATHFLDAQWKTTNRSQNTIRIFNAEGRVVKTITIKGGVNNQRISLEGLAKGIYMLVLKTGSDQQASKFVIQ